MKTRSAGWLNARSAGRLNARSAGRRLAAGLAVLSLGAAVAARAADTPEEPGQSMREIFQALQILLPPSLDDDRFGDPAQRERIQEALSTLSQGAVRLDAHGRARDAGFSFLSRSLAQDARDIERRYAAGRHREARFLLHQLIDTCVACHSRLPDPRESSLAVRFMDEGRIAELPAIERVRFETATRQFERALETYEDLLQSTSVSASDLDLMGHLDAYLEIALRVRNDPKRAEAALQRFSRRPDLPAPLRGNVRYWLVSLEALQDAAAPSSGLERGRVLMGEARNTERFPDDRSALVHYIAASGALHRYVDAHRVKDPDLGEAYYLLGRIEARVGRSFWLSQTEFLLETAIRTAPGAAWAEDAFALLEEFITLGHTGSAGVHVPPEKQRLLIELQELIEGAGEGPVRDARARLRPPVPARDAASRAGAPPRRARRSAWPPAPPRVAAGD